MLVHVQSCEDPNCIGTKTCEYTDCVGTETCEDPNRACKKLVRILRFTLKFGIVSKLEFQRRTFIVESNKVFTQ